MKITDLLDKRSISLDAAPASKSEALDLAVELMAKSGKLSDVEAYRRQVYAREEESTTGIGEGTAISTVLLLSLIHILTARSLGTCAFVLSDIAAPLAAWTLIPWTASR